MAKNGASFKFLKLIENENTLFIDITLNGYNVY